MTPAEKLEKIEARLVEVGNVRGHQVTLSDVDIAYLAGREHQHLALIEAASKLWKIRPSLMDYTDASRELVSAMVEMSQAVDESKEAPK